VLDEKIDELIELSARVLAVVAALATLAFAFVRQEVLDDHIDLYHATPSVFG
jgi:predicted transcriptional regulator